MNTQTTFHCLDFRRARLADPQHLPPAALAHQQGCTACQDFARRADATEARIARVLEVPVPEGLAERIILQTRASRGGAAAWRLAGLAATVLLSVGVGLATWLPERHGDYARHAIEHVLHEPEAFGEHRLADPREFGTVLARFGGEMRQPIGRVRYMKLCPVPGGTGWHIVIDTEYGPATLLLIPGKRTGADRLEAEMKGLVAAARPGGDGYYAVVTESRASLEAIGGLLDQRVRWRL